jgi:hypothetical protein
VEDPLAMVAPIEDVVAVAGRGGSQGAWHAGNLGPDLPRSPRDSRMTPFLPPPLGRRRGAPGAMARRQGPAPRLEAGADPVADPRPLRDQPPAELDQRPPLADLGLGHVDRRQLAQAVQPDELQRVVAVGLPLDLLPSPGLAQRVGDAAIQAELAAEVVDPAGGGAGLEQDQRGRRPLQDGAERLGVGGDRLEAVSLRVRVEEAGDALELAQVDADDRSHGRVASGGVRGLSAPAFSLTATRLSWSLSAPRPDHGVGPPLAVLGMDRATQYDRNLRAARSRKRP